MNKNKRMIVVKLYIFATKTIVHNDDYYSMLYVDSRARSMRTYCSLPESVMGQCEATGPILEKVKTPKKETK